MQYMLLMIPVDNDADYKRVLRSVAFPPVVLACGEANKWRVRCGPAGAQDTDFFGVIDQVAAELGYDLNDPKGPQEQP